MYYYDVVASICTETCRIDSHLICGGFNTLAEAMNYSQAHNISEVDYECYCKDNEIVYIEIEEKDALSGNIVDILTI
jgi:hypothetical protein